MIILKDWIPGQARDDTVYSLVDLFRGNLSTISLFHLQKSCWSCRSCYPRSI